MQEKSIYSVRRMADMMDAALLEYSLKLVFPTPRPIAPSGSGTGGEKATDGLQRTQRPLISSRNAFLAHCFRAKTDTHKLERSKPFHPTQRIVPDKTTESAFRCVDM